MLSSGTVVRRNGRIWKVFGLLHDLGSLPPASSLLLLLSVPTREAEEAGRRPAQRTDGDAWVVRQDSSHLVPEGPSPPLAAAG